MGSIAREALYEWNGRTFRRAPDFSELVRRAHASTKISRDQRVLLAERLAGIARRCARCQTEIRVGQLCQCGHIGAIGDPKYVLSEEERATAQRDQAPVCRAWQTLSALKQAGAAVPTGSVQVLALADALVNEATSSAAAHALLATWQQKRMKVSIDVAALIEAIDRAAASS